MLAAAHLSTGRLWVLGAIAGFTIFLGLPLGRIANPAPRLRTVLNAVAIGILVFLLFDVLSHANEPVEHALEAAKDGTGNWWRFAGLAGTLTLGLAVGLVSLVYVDRRTARRAGTGGPGAMRIDSRGGVTSAERLAIAIATGIGLHNFSEGLAIGQSAAKGEIGLALLLVIGFGLHNATEGFGIVAPLAAEDDRPTWGFLAAMGFIGGGPTFLGTVVGRSFTNDTIFLAFLAVAAGSILYVVFQLVKVCFRQGSPELMMWGVLAGLLLGFATDYVLVAAGA